MNDKPLGIWDWTKSIYWLVVSLGGCISFGLWIGAGAPTYQYSDWGIILGLFFWISTSIIVFRPPPGRSE